MRRILVELLVLIPGSMFVGWFIGTVQHYVAFGFLGGGFGSDSMWLACFEGGIVGAAFGIPTGIITFYIGLLRQVTPRKVGAVVFGSLLAGCLVALLGLRLWGDAFVPISTVTTPCLTFILANVIRIWGGQQEKQSR